MTTPPQGSGASPINPASSMLQALTWLPPAIEYNSVISFPYSQPIILKSLPPRPLSPSTLHILPIELLQQIFLELDFTSLGRLRLSNYDIKTHIDVFLPYQVIVTYAFKTLCAMRETRTLVYHPLGRLYNVLKSTKCEICSDYGPFLFLLTCSRVCFNCLYRSPKLRLISGALMEVYCGLPEKQIAQHLPAMQALTGNYSLNEVRCMGYDILYSLHSCREVACAYYEGEENMNEAVQKVYERMVADDDDYARRQEAIYGIVRYARNARRNPLLDLYPERDPDSNEEMMRNWERRNVLDKYRCVGAAAFPTLDREGEVESGVWCGGCDNKYQRWLEEEDNPEMRGEGFVGGWEGIKGLQRDLLKAWTREEYLRTHFKECKDSWRILETHKASLGLDASSLMGRMLDDFAFELSQSGRLAAHAASN